MEMKTCKCCGTTKIASPDYFYRSKLFDDGLHDVCRTCQSAIDIAKDDRKVKRMYGVYTLEQDYIEEVTKR